jgi:hypothetical protein
MAYMQFNGDGNNGGMSFGAGTSATSRQSIAERMRITNTGNVGIGTSNPGSLLQVGPGTTNSPSTVASLGGTVSGILSALSLVNTNGIDSPGYGTALDFHLNSAYSPTGRIATLAESSNPSASLVFYTYGGGLGEKMRITSTGNVGIGTTSPFTTLELKANDPVQRFSVNGGVANNKTYEIRGIGAIGFEGLQFRAVNDANTVYDSLMFLARNGNVGIGTTNPALSNLVISPLVGTGTVDGLTVIYHPDGGTNRLRAKLWINDFNGQLDLKESGDTQTVKITANGSSYFNGGNVGIGTTSPGNKLVVDYTTNGANGIVSRNLSTGGSAYAFVGAFNNSGNGIDLRSYPSTNLAFPSTSFVSSGSGQTGGMIITQAGGNPISLWTNGSEKMRVTSGGNIGIGTSTPSVNLEVKGTDSLVSPTIRVTHDTGIVAMSMDLICDVFSAAGIINVGANGNTIFS